MPSGTCGDEMTVAVVRTAEGLETRHVASRWRADRNGPGALWASYYADAANHAHAMRALGVGIPCTTHADRAAAIVLIKMGVTWGGIVCEAAPKAEGWIDAPLWRPALASSSEAVGQENLEEEALEAVLLPVAAGAHARSAVAVRDFGSDPATVVDVIAVPSDGSRARSLTGCTAAVGFFSASSSETSEDRATVRFAANGIGWLMRHAQRARDLADNVSAGDVANILPLIGFAETLMLEPEAFDWRAGSLGNVLPAGTKTVACVDSRALADRLHAAMKVQAKRPPVVLMPTVSRDVA